MTRRLTSGGSGDRRRPGYVLIAVLIVIVVLSLVAYRFGDAMSGEYRAAARAADWARARAAAVSGIHYAAALISDPLTRDGDLGGNIFDNPAFADVPVWADPANPGRQARFSLLAVVPTGPGFYETRPGVVDEGGKLNINALIAQDPTGVFLYNALLKIPNMTEELAANIVDWVDADDTPGSAANGAAVGAENEYYASLANPYRCKNGPLNTLDELLLVKGVTPQLLYGTDRNQNGRADPGEGGSVDRGWQDYLTVYGREVASDPTGLLKIWINDEDPAAIYAAMRSAGLPDEIAAYIMAAKLFGSVRVDANGNPVPQFPGGGQGKGGGRGGGKGPPPGKGGGRPNQPVRAGSLDELIEAVETRLATITSSGRAINSLVDLIDTRVNLPRLSGGGKGPPVLTVYYSPLNDRSRAAELLPLLYERLATREAVELVPRVNINTAPREVIEGIFTAAGLTSEDVDAVLSAREGLAPDDPGRASGIWVMTVAGLTRAKFRAVERYITGTSMVFRVQSVGYLDGGGPVARVEAVIDTNLGAPRILYFRDLTDLDSPRGFAVGPAP